MVCVFASDLRGWMKEFKGVDRVNFRPLGLNALFSLQDVPIRHEILQGATHFWDPKVHVFRFGYEELCPTVEEFQALLEYRPRKSIVVPTIQVSAVTTLQTMLSLSRSKAVQFLPHGEFNVLRLIEHFRPMGDPNDEAYQKRRRAALCIALLARYLLVPGNGKVSHSLAMVTSQMLEDKNIVPLILAETLLGLDQICAKGAEGTLLFAGSPLLLQVIIPAYASSSFFLNGNFFFL